jgi:hypothetical protein
MAAESCWILVRTCTSSLDVAFDEFDIGNCLGYLANYCCMIADKAIGCEPAAFI